MAQIDEELAKLKQTKADIAKSITDKGGVLENPSNFSSYSMEIDKLNDFSVIGYESTPDVFQKQINYSKNIMNQSWEFTSSQFSSNKDIYYFPAVDGNKFPEDMSYFFYNSTITYIPPIDLTHVTTFYTCFRDCNNLYSFDFTKVKVNNDANFGYMFQGCLELQKITFPKGFAPKLISGMFSGCNNISFYPNLDAIDYSGVTDISYFLNNTKVGELPVMNTSNCTNFENMLGDNSNLTRIEELDVSKGESIILSRSVGGLQNLSYMLLKGIGTNDNLTRISLNWVDSIWGSNRDYSDARQSLIDTLITYSADRTGKEPATIILREATKGHLTADEIAQIEAKNYTIETNDAYIE